MNTWIFRKALPEEAETVFGLIQQRIIWMDEKGIDGWNRMNYLAVYPLSHYQEILQDLFVLEKSETKEILCAGALYQSDERWDTKDSALYLHHFVSKVGSCQAGTFFLHCAEDYAGVWGKEYFRLDSAVGNPKLAAYYRECGYIPVGTCADGPYQGIRWQKKLNSFTLRTADRRDLDQIAAVEAACFPPAEAATQSQFAKRIAYYKDYFWLLFDGNTLVSFVDGFVTNEEDLTDEMYDSPEMHDPNGAWQMIFGVNTIPAYRRKGCAERLLLQAIQDAKRQGRKGLVLTCKEYMVHYYAKFGFQNEGISEKSVHGSVVWNQMRLTF